MRQRPFCIAGDRHEFPLLVRAPQRGLRCMLNKQLCMGLPLIVARCPTPRLDGADDSLAAGMNVDVLNRDLLLAALASVPVEGLQKRDVGAGELIRLVQVLLPAFEALFPDHCPPIALHRSRVRGDELAGEHAFELVLGRDPGEGRSGCRKLTRPLASWSEFFIQSELTTEFARTLLNASETEPPIRLSLPERSPGSSEG